MCPSTSLEPYFAGCSILRADILLAFNVPFSSAPVSLTLCPTWGKAFLAESESSFSILLSSVTNTTGDPSLTHFWAHDLKALGLIQSEALVALEPLFAHISSEI